MHTEGHDERVFAEAETGLTLLSKRRNKKVLPPTSQPTTYRLYLYSEKPAVKDTVVGVDLLLGNVSPCVSGSQSYTLHSVSLFFFPVTNLAMRHLKFAVVYCDLDWRFFLHAITTVNSDLTRAPPPLPTPMHIT